ncbi:hypothetical protein ABIF63_008953 [Bradyrhizobium japonicum]|uniref:Uncharacterized protein n=1 Tax=Bradyrhizobium japonicum TaxID=375 RepID=A0ABV2S6P5_BRAJP|nr:hypothetical protein [Bradyrhizobium sp. CCBAU 15544]
MALNSPSAFACGGIFDAACNTAHGGLSPDNVAKQTAKVVQDAAATTVKAVDDTGKTVEKSAHDGGHTLEKAAQDGGGKTIEKAAQDSGKTIEKAVQDTGKAGETVYKFGVRQIESIGDSVKALGRSGDKWTINWCDSP